ncbi:NAD(P)-binding Rossmann-like domain protein, partial [Actinomyces sp. ICM58]|uniref:NAD(P)-binding protein n=2 Tax=unclassified Actinomyces TaxID=2609248 RepID=UPI0002771838
MSPRSATPTHPGAVVVGGGIAGLVAAWELARAGTRPLLIEARGYLGGLIARGTVGGVDVDLGAETYVVRGTDTSSIVDALGLTSVEPA